MRPSYRCVSLLLLLLLGCGAAPVSSSEDVKKLVDDGAIVVDVRSKEEYDSGHLSQALHLPHDQILELSQRPEVKKDTPLVIYCQSGRRSGIAMEALKKAGYTKVHDAGSYSEIKAVLEP